MGWGIPHCDLGVSTSLSGVSTANSSQHCGSGSAPAAHGGDQAAGGGSPFPVTCPEGGGTDPAGPLGELAPKVAGELLLLPQSLRLQVLRAEIYIQT